MQSLLSFKSEDYLFYWSRDKQICLRCEVLISANNKQASIEQLNDTNTSSASTAREQKSHIGQRVLLFLLCCFVNENPPFLYNNHVRRWVRIASSVSIAQCSLLINCHRRAICYWSSSG